MKRLMIASATAAVLAGASQGAATPLEEAMASCRRAEDLTRRVTACTFVIETSHDRRTLLRAYNTRGLALCNLDRCAEAVSDFDRVVAIEPSIAGYFDNRARALRAANRLPEAIADSERAMRMAPGYAFTYLGKAYSQEAGGHFEDALATVEQALAIDPKNAGTWEYRGKILAKLQRWETADASFARAQALEPPGVSVFKTRGDVKAEQGDLKGALEDYDRYPASGDDADEVKHAKDDVLRRLRERDDGAVRDSSDKRIRTLEAEKQAAVDRATSAERSTQIERERADRAQAQSEIEKRRADAARTQSEGERSRADKEKARAESERVRADNEKKRADSAEARDHGDSNTSAARPDHEINQEEANRLQRSVLDLEAQVLVLKDVLREQRQIQGAKGSDAQMIGVTAALTSKQMAERQAELDSKQKHLDRYLEARPAERDRLSKMKRPDRAYPHVAYNVSATQESGELWLEPALDPTGVLVCQLRFLAPRETTRETISLTASELADAQVALAKIRTWSLKAYEKGIRSSYSKRAACFPQAGCPDEGSAMEGKPYTEFRFIIRDDGSTVARIQRGSGQSVVGYDLSSDSALLVGAYMTYARTIASREFNAPRSKPDLDKLFQ